MTGTAIPADGSALLAYEEKTGKITSSGFEYDVAGNLTRAPRRDGLVQELQYDASGRLALVLTPRWCMPACAPSQVGEVFRYGSDRHRIVSENLTFSTDQFPTPPPRLNTRTYYVWSGDMLFAEYNETAAASSEPRWTRSYLYLGERLLATFEPGLAGEEVRYHHPDRLGTTRLITNPAQDATVNHFVMPYGTSLGTEPDTTKDRQFTSYERSPVTGLDYAFNRFYDSVTGRFMQVDPLRIAGSRDN
jgi:RHS repeat-associated protein